MGKEEGSNSSSGRVLALDALRGFDMLWIIGLSHFLTIAMKNSDGALALVLKGQLKHTKWEGFTAWDLIMPLFLFMAGTSMPFSFGKRLESGDSKWGLYRKVFSRFALLWILGGLCQGNWLLFDLSKFYIYTNTLQSIAAGYLIAALVFLNVRVTGQIVATAGLCVLYCALLHLMPNSTHVDGVLTAQGNLAMSVDKAVLGRFMPPQTTYAYTWVLSSLTFGATVLLGVMAGHVLKTKSFGEYRKVVVLAGLGAAGVGIGYLMHVTFDPIIKKIWTSSMVLFAGGWSFLLLGLFYLVIDVLGFKKWAFVFVVVGMNSIFAYTLTHVLGTDLTNITQRLVGGLARHMGEWGSAFLAFTRLAMIWLILFYMYRKRIFLRV